MPLEPLSRHRLAQIIAADIPEGSYVNVGIGIPTLVAEHLDPAREIILHSENGILGLRGLHDGEQADPDLINASKIPVQLLPGASISDQATSFAMMRGGHLDLTILGGFQVAPNGDLASWSLGRDGDVPGIGGAMDLVAGARRVVVAMPHTDRQGNAKLVTACTLPLTGRGVVDTLYTDLAVIDVTPDCGFVVRRMLRGLTRDALQAATAAPLTFADDVTPLDP